MSICHEKARELGEFIRNSEQAMALSSARQGFAENPESQERMRVYTEMQASLQESVEKAQISEKQMELSTRKLFDMAGELKSDPVIVEMIRAENEYSQFVNQIMVILKMTITGEWIDNTGDAGLCGCGGCKGGLGGHGGHGGPGRGVLH